MKVLNEVIKSNRTRKELKICYKTKLSENINEKKKKFRIKKINIGINTGIRVNKSVEITNRTRKIRGRGERIKIFEFFFAPKRRI